MQQIAGNIDKSKRQLFTDTSVAVQDG
jgi:hypothetical protein